MRIAIVGGGPAGLYFAILAKRLDPAHDVRVYERNAADDTFGFGVVFSDETLEADRGGGARDVRRARPAVRPLGRDRHPLPRRGRHLGRPRLLGAEPPRAARRAPAARRRARRGAALPHRGRRPSSPDADLIVGADGVNSTVRARHEARVPAVAGPAPLEVHVARHRARVRRLQVLHRRDRARRLPGPRLSLRQHDEHVHRGDLGGDLAARGARPRRARWRRGRATPRASRSARSCSPTRSTATA